MLPDLAQVLQSSNRIDAYVNLIPARYYCPEDGTKKKGVQTTTAISTRTKKRNKQAPVNNPRNALSKSELREKLLAKIQEVQAKRKSTGDGKKRKRGEKRAHSEEVSFPNVVATKTAQSKQYEEATAGSKKRHLENDIRNIERKQEKVNRIGSVAERTEVQHSDRMEKALRRAQGTKIRDNVAKLKKTLKTKEKKKDKGKQEWKGRVDTVKQKNADRQAKRKENIQKYRTKKGKNRKNGFEGQGGKDFLNKDSET